VDDVPANLVATAAALEQPDYRIVQAASGEDALRCALAEDFAVILLDVHMPGLDGVETARLLRQRERSRHTPIIYVTVTDAELLRAREGYNLGASDYIFKPVADPAILRSKVAVFARLFHQTHALEQRAAALEAAKTALEAEVARRQEAEAALRRHEAGLEQRVQGSTSELRRLLAEVELARKHQAGLLEDQKRVDAALRQANRALRMIGECSQVLVRAADEAALLQAICRKIVEHGGYRLAWIGYAEQDAAQSVRPVAQFGFEEGYLDTVNITWADTERGRGPTGTAIRTGQADVARNIPTDPGFAPWRAAALQRGYASSIALPLVCGKGILPAAEKQAEPPGSTGKMPAPPAPPAAFGALNVYAAEPEAFDAEEVALLSELAGNLAYGIGALRERAAREKAENGTFRRGQEQAALSALISATATTLDLPTVLDHALRGALALTGMEGGTLCLVDADRQSLELAAHVNTSEETIRELTTNDIKIGECLCGNCAKTGEPLILWDNASGSQYATREATRNEGIRFHAAFPLLVSERGQPCPPAGMSSPEPSDSPPGFGVRQPSGALGSDTRALESGRGLPHSKTLARNSGPEPASADQTPLSPQPSTLNELGPARADKAVRAQTRCIGVLCIFAKTGAKPTERSLQLVQDLCGPVALVIENARLFQAEQRQLKELRRWYEATLGREDRVRELKREVNELRQRLGEPIRYQSQEGGDGM
jgi:CheY-like chemotaxis protein/GAF domain-containing protein